MKTEYMLNREVDLVLAALTPANRLVMRVALHTGLRVGDVLALKSDQLKPHFWVTESKTGKRRQVGLPQPLLTDLKKNRRSCMGVRRAKPGETPHPASGLEGCEAGSQGVPASGECWTPQRPEGVCSRVDGALW